MKKRDKLIEMIEGEKKLIRLLEVLWDLFFYSDWSGNNNVWL